MPYSLVKADEGYYVVTTETGRRHSNLPMPREKAEAQLRILESILHSVSGSLLLPSVETRSRTKPRSKSADRSAKRTKY